MEKDIVKAIETASPANNEENKDYIISVKLVDEEERFQDGYRDGESVTIQYRYNNNKSQSGSLFFLRERRPAHLVGIKWECKRKEKHL